LEDVIDLNDLRGCSYYEPYVGGAGAALSLLQSGCVSSIHINDADPRIFSFWKTIISETPRFVDAIFSTPIDIETWHRHKSICEAPSGYSSYEVGFSTFFMNRCNRSGVLRGAGPIGGMAQEGKWRMDVRFNRQGLSKRILEIASMKDNIHVHNMDAIDFLKQHLPAGLGRKKVFAYLDPPYVNKADRLYMNTYEQQDHREIASYIIRQNMLNWLMSYDDTQIIRSLYNEAKISHMPIRYSLQSKKLSKELIIAPQRLILPTAFSEVHDNSQIC
jgi:DNA adenine methylase